jgi:8-oxo-dGTP diphosphatase
MTHEDGSPPTFGRAPDGVTVEPRPGAYAIVPGDDGRLALVRSARGLYLLGGGSEPGETPEQTVVREACEECGLTLVPGVRLGSANELMHVPEENGWIEKRGVFLVARLGTGSGGPNEPDHELVWVAPGEARAGLAHASHRWAVERWLAQSPGQEA